MARDLDDMIGDGTFDPDASEPMQPSPDAPRPRVLPFGYLYKQSLERFERRARGTERPVPLVLGGAARMFGGMGLWPGLYVLMGNTGAGKTQLALQLALDAADDGVPAAYVGLELGPDDWVARTIGAHTGTPWSSLFWGTLNTAHLDADLDTARRAGDELANKPLYLIEGAPQGFAPGDLHSSAHELRKLHPNGPALLVVDYLQLIGSTERDDMRSRVGAAAYACRVIARDLGLAVLVVSSISRANYSRLRWSTDQSKGDDPGLFVEGGMGRLKNPDALIGVGKESGDIEFAADAVLVMLRLAERDGVDHLALVAPKVRAARPSWVALRFDGHKFEGASLATAEQILRNGQAPARDEQIEYRGL